MIKLKNRPSKPQKLKSQSAADAKTHIADLVNTKGSLRSTDFNGSIWREKNVKKALHKFQNGKCCYCERKRDCNGEVDVEHYRPKTEIKDGNCKQIGYWWMAYKWKNLFLACKTCNGAKLTKFPLLKDGVRALSKESSLKDELPVIPNPETDDVESLFSWNFEPELELVQITSRGLRAAEAIDVLGLDSDLLCEARGLILTELSTIAEGMDDAVKVNIGVVHYGEKIKKATRRKLEFVAMRRAYFVSRGYKNYMSDD